MKDQVRAIFVFIGVVVLMSAFLGGSFLESDSVAVAPQEISSESEYALASAILAIGDRRQENPFGFGLLTPIENKGGGKVEENKEEPEESPAGSGGSTGVGTIDPEPEEEPVVSATPTQCNLFITEPLPNELVPDTFVVAGYVDDITANCSWTIFEANAGGIEVYDDNDNLLSDYLILNSVGPWMQFPSYFQALTQLNADPETQTGYIRFYEHQVNESIPDVFDYPISFEEWSAVSPGAESGGFFNAITNFLRNRNEPEPEPEPEPVREPSNIFGGDDQESTLDNLFPAGEDVPVADRTDDFCEVRDENDNRLICYGEYIDGGQEVCGCTVFASLNSFRQQAMLQDFTVSAPDTSFEKTLFIGDRGDAVEMLQEALFVLGHYDQIPSRVYDTKTVRAVRAFQRENNLSGWGLIVGEGSNDILNRLFSN